MNDKGSDDKEVTLEEERVMTTISNIIIDRYLAMTPAERKLFNDKVNAEEKLKSSKQTILKEIVDCDYSIILTARLAF